MGVPIANGKDSIEGVPANCNVSTHGEWADPAHVADECIHHREG